jgi:cellulose synthase/poly-beta-1,6-N-acetylglucosamine synthase-like glycosyltransferase
MTLARTILDLTQQGVIAYFLLLYSVVALLLILAIRELSTHWHIAEDEQLARVLASPALPPLSILVTAHGAHAATAERVRSYLALEYPRHEVILVSDGMPDALAREYDLYQVPPAVMVTLPTALVRGYYRSRRYSKLLLIDKEHAGMADTLNAAVNAARYPYVLAVDADTLLEPDALLRMARPFLVGKSVAVVGAAIRVAAVGRADEAGHLAPGVAARWLSGVQQVESLRALVFSRLGWNRLGGHMIMSGALGLFLRDHVLAIGGYRGTTADEASDLAVRVHRYLREEGLPSEIRFVPDLIAWTAPLPTRRALALQRERWHRGLIELLVSNRDLMFSAQYGMTGLVACPYLLFGEILAPIVEVAGYVCLLVALATGGIGAPFIGLFLLVVPGYAALLSCWAILLGRSGNRAVGGSRALFRLLAWALVEPFGYRQMMLWVRLRASWRFLRGEHSWRGTPRDVAVGRANPVSEGI